MGLRMTPVSSISTRHVLLAYYAATALFLLLDYGFSINVRLAFLDAHPDWRGAYYGLCFGCLALIIWRPALDVIVGAVESLLTLVALILHLALRVMLISDDMLETGAGFVTMPEIINFLISGGIAYFAWAQGMKSLR